MSDRSPLTAFEVYTMLRTGFELAEQSYTILGDIRVEHCDSIVRLSDSQGDYVWSVSAPDILAMDGNPSPACRAIAGYASRKLGLEIVV